MKLFVLNTLAALSLLLCVAVAVLGARSFSRKDKLEYVSAGGRLVLLISSRGRLDVLYSGRWKGDPGFTHIRGSPSAGGLTDSSRRFLGFGAGGRPGDGTRFVNVPYWFVALACGLPFALAVRARRRRGDAVSGRCGVCGYDLRASPDRCPECGTQVAVRKTSAGSNGSEVDGAAQSTADGGGMLDPSRWQIRCLTCGRTRRALDAGIVRLGSANRTYTIGWCSQCRWLRRAVLEPTPERGFEVVAPGPRAPKA